VTEADISTSFSAFGSVTSASIVRGSDGVSRGFAFISFSSPEEATRAVNEMNKKLWHGRPLYVSLAQRKDVRQRQLAEELAVRRLIPWGGGGVCTGRCGCVLLTLWPHVSLSRACVECSQARSMHAGGMNRLGAPGMPQAYGGFGGYMAAPGYPGGPSPYGAPPGYVPLPPATFFMS
jgi:polyadenylate-binding protein